MALSAYAMKELCSRINGKCIIASMGYPDMIAPLPLVEKILGERFNDLEYREDSEKICRRHGISESKIPDSKSFFSLLGAELDVFDIVKVRGDEIICDLNEPYESECQYDFVIDIGTMEHCFNIGQAALNMVWMLKSGGFIIHENPFLMGNHGFYSLNPTWYYDFYGQDGFKLISCVMKTSDGRIKDTPKTERFAYEGKEANIVAIAQRTADLPAMYPCQTKYRKGNLDGTH